MRHRFPVASLSRPSSPTWHVNAHHVRTCCGHLRDHHARCRRPPSRRANSRPPRRPENHQALRPCPQEPRQTPELHPRRLCGFWHLTRLPVVPMCASRSRQSVSLCEVVDLGCDLGSTESAFQFFFAADTSTQTIPLLPSWSAITVSEGALLSSTTVPPAATAAAMRCSATSGAT